MLIVHQIMILLRPHNLLVVLLLSPLLKVEHSRYGKVVRAAVEVGQEINRHLSALKDQSFTRSHARDQRFANLFYGVGFSHAADGHCKLELVNLYQVGFVAEEYLTVTSGVKN